jgi:hypothetical protein
MALDMITALRMAKAADVTYYVDKPGGVTACPFYAEVGFIAFAVPRRRSLAALRQARRRRPNRARRQRPLAGE